MGPIRLLTLLRVLVIGAGNHLQAGACMGSEQHQLYDDKGAGVDNICLSQQGLHDGNDQRGGIKLNAVAISDILQEKEPFLWLERKNLPTCADCKFD